MVSGGMNCVKYLLFFFNLIFAVSGIAVLTVGAIIQSAYYDYTHFLDDRVFSAPLLLIIVGAIVFVVAFFGCCGAMKENHCMIITFSVLLVLIFVLELAGGIAGYVLRDDVKEMLETKMNQTMYAYGNGTDSKKSWDVLQHDLKCCGIDGPRDWERVFQNETLPGSCCLNDIEHSCSYSKNATVVYQTGCLAEFQDFIESNALKIGGVGIGIAFIQVSGIAVLTVGAIIQSAYYDYTHFLDDRVFSAPLLLIIVGAIVFVVAFFGCCGAMKENHCMIITFSVLLVLIFVLELAGGIAGYVLRDDVKEMLETKMNQTMYAYGNGTDSKKSWDVLQHDLKCCGIDGPRDWERVFQNETLPGSCCLNDIEHSCSYSKNATVVYQTGCLAEFQDFIESNALKIGGVGIGIAFIQLVGVIFACCLAKSIRKEYETV